MQYEGFITKYKIYQNNKTMIRAEVRFKNSAFMKALERSKYNSIAEFSRESGIGYQYLVEYANLRHSFKKIEDQVKIKENDKGGKLQFGKSSKDSWTSLLSRFSNLVFVNLF